MPAMRLTVPSFSSAVSTVSGTASGGPEHVDLGRLVRLDRRLGLRRHAGRADPQQRVARLGRPARGGHRVLGAVDGGDHHERSSTARPPRPRAARSTAAASAAGFAAVDVGGLVALDRRLGPDADDLRPARLLGAGRLQRVQRGLGRVRDLVPVGEQDRRVDRRADEHRRGDPGAPVAHLGEDHRGRARLGRARGIRGERDRGGVGDRVAAGHARRVLGGEDREAERRPARGHLVAGLAGRPEGVEIGSASCRRHRRRNRRRAGKERPRPGTGSARGPERSGSLRKERIRARDSRSRYDCADHKLGPGHPPSGP